MPKMAYEHKHFKSDTLEIIRQAEAIITEYQSQGFSFRRNVIMNEYHENFEIKKDVLHVHLSGKFPDELLRSPENLFQPLIEACSEYGCKKVLIDARDLELHFKTIDLFRAGKDAASLASLGIRIAFLTRETMIDPFFDDVAYNRGGQICVFTSIDSAQDWLQM